jgi:polyhydroxybutyrate depolymerase
MDPRRCRARWALLAALAALAGISTGCGQSAGGQADAAPPLSGCGATRWPAGGSGAPETIMVVDASGETNARTFFVLPPADYDPKTSYRLIFAWHYQGGTATDLIASGVYGIPALLPEAIYVVGQGLPDGSGRPGWGNANGQDLAFTRAMIAWSEAHFCVDPARLMSTGMSAGGEMSDLIGCEMPDVFRAVGVMSGALAGYGPGNCLGHPIAAWITHGTADSVIDISFGETAVDQFVLDDGCATTTSVPDPTLPCVSYDGCAPGNPVVWCPVSGGGHEIPSFAAPGIAGLFSQF